MRDQYAGDISDLLKLAFLRALVSPNDTLGIGWYYNAENDGRPDGKHRGYRDEPKWKALDAELWEALRGLPNRSVELLEQLPTWPRGTRFHRVAIPNASQRSSWVLSMEDALLGSSIVFLDPDNGIGDTNRHVRFNEVAGLRQSGRTIVVIKFPSREKHDIQLERYHARLLDQTGCSSLFTIRTMARVPHPSIRWFTIIDGTEALIARAEVFSKSLGGITGCKADIARTVRDRSIASTQSELRGTKDMSIRPPKRQDSKGQRVCPECGYRFKGDGFEGIDAHWRARHEELMPYSQAWPLIESGGYRHSPASP